MTPTRILPDLQCSLLCEEVRQEANGNFIVIGILDVLRVPQLPITAFKLTVFNRWTAGVGVFTESVRFLAPDQTTLLCKSEVKFQMKTPSINSTAVSLFTNVQFTAPGPYYIEVLVDDVMKVRYPINVVLVQLPNQAQPQPPAPPQGSPPAS
jgi:hypothetical protein